MPTSDSFPGIKVNRETRKKPGPPDFAPIPARMFAYLIDVLPILALVIGVFYFCSDFGVALKRYLDLPNSLDARIDFLVYRGQIRLSTFVAYLMYSALLESSPWQATIGKRLMGLRVGDSRGNRLGFFHALCRNVAKFVSALPLGLGFLWALWSKKHQPWHDMIACTSVSERAGLNSKHAQAMRRMQGTERPGKLENCQRGCGLGFMISLPIAILFSGFLLVGMWDDNQPVKSLEQLQWFCIVLGGFIVAIGCLVGAVGYAASASVDPYRGDGMTDESPEESSTGAGEIDDASGDAPAGGLR